MSFFKCKMCGGDLTVSGNEKIVECEYCGSRQTVPDGSSEKKVTLFNRANRLRIACDFDRAASVYEQIISQFPEEAEAYWGLCLCNYGIEYVDDPATARKIPTCHRASFEQLRKDSNYELALENADMEARLLYQDEAKEIDRIRGEILSISRNEKPYDIFICYKETDSRGSRTPDSVLAQDIYDSLTAKGYKVFFSRITLEDKLGMQYEPYIFAALNSAKVMLVVGTDYEYLSAVWVRNEWSRYLKLAAKDKSKVLIPCYRDMDPYDLPDEFRGLQAQDCGKLGYLQDLTRGIDKLLGRTAQETPKEEPKPVKETVVINQTAPANIAPLLKRAFLFLEDGKWTEADEYCERVLDMDPECAEAYLGKLMAELKVKTRNRLADCAEPFGSNENYAKVIRFGSDSLKAELRGDVNHIIERNETARLTNIYNSAVKAMNAADTEEAYKAVAKAFQNISGFRDADTLSKRCLDKAAECKERAEQARLAKIYNTAFREMNAANSEQAYKSAANTFQTIRGFKNASEMAQKCLSKAEICRKDAVYAAAKSKMTGEKVAAYEEAIKIFQTIPGWKDVDEQISACRSKIDEIKAKEKVDRIAAEKAEKRKDRNINIAVIITLACVMLPILFTTVIIPNQRYNEAVKLYNAGEYEDAIAAFEALGGYKDSVEQVETIKQLYYKELPSSAEVGDTITFGAYEQDNDTNNGKEGIEWLVLAKEDDKILVISKYALDCRLYSISDKNITWESCTLRKWLNSIFLNNAFSTEDQAMIQSTTVSADKNPNYSTTPGNATTDKIFLLSITEVEKYFSSDNDRMCVPTAYAVAQGAYTSSSDTKGGAATCRWWLRSPGSSSTRTAYATNDGSIYYFGYTVNYACGCVRPAMWISIES